jgi:hypothetical protein
MSERGSETAGESPAAQQAASERRTIEAAGRNRKLAAAALMRLGGDCPPQLEEVGTEVILHSHYPWSEIGRRLGLTRQQVISRFPPSARDRGHPRTRQRRGNVTAGFRDRALS